MMFPAWIHPAVMAGSCQVADLGEAEFCRMHLDGCGRSAANRRPPIILRGVVVSTAAQPAMPQAIPLPIAGAEQNGNVQAMVPTAFGGGIWVRVLATSTRPSLSLFAMGAGTRHGRSPITTIAEA